MSNEYRDFLDALSDSAYENMELLRKEYAHRLQREISQAEYIKDMVNDYGLDINDIEDAEGFFWINTAMLMHVCECEVSND